MYWKLDSFDHARREFPRFRDLHDETRDVYWGAHADHDIDWDYFESEVNRRFRNPAADNYQIDWSERNEDNTIDWSTWSVSKILVAPQWWFNELGRNTLCSCVNSRLQNNDYSELEIATASTRHDNVHRFANHFLSLNGQMRVQPNWRAIDESELRIQPMSFIEYSNAQLQNRYMNNRFLKMTAKHEQFKSRAMRIAGDNIFHVFVFLADETGTTVNVVHGHIAVRDRHGEPNDMVYQLGDMGDPASVFNGYYDTFVYNPYEDKMYNPYSYGSVRQYKECKICGLQINKNNTVFMIDMMSSSNRYSACFLCAVTHTAGYNPTVEAFVRLPNGLPSSERAVREYFNYQEANGGRPKQWLMPFWRRQPTRRATSAYQWEDVTDISEPTRTANIIGARDDVGDNVPITLSLEARKLLSWAQEISWLFRPEYGAESSPGHIGSLFTWLEFHEGEVDSIIHFHSMYDDPVCLNPTEDFDDPDDYTYAYSTQFTELEHDESGRVEYFDTDDGTYREIYDHCMLLGMYVPSQWEGYLQGHGSPYRRASATPRRRERVVIERNPIHIVRHGLPNMDLEKKPWNFTFPIWQVGMGIGAHGRLIKPINQTSWSNGDALSERQRRAMLQLDRFLQGGLVSSDDGKTYQNNLFGPFYGMELEMIGRRIKHDHNIDRMENTHRRLIELFHPSWTVDTQTQKTQIAWRVQDSSVDSGSPWGHEVVTQPLSLEAWHHVPADFWDSLKENYTAYYWESNAGLSNGGERNRGNGIHIHIDHDNFTTGHLWAFLDYFYRVHHYVEVLGYDWEDTLLGQVAQRPSGQWAYWNLPIHMRGGRSITDLNKVIGLTAIRRRIDRRSTSNDPKYDGINFEKDGTIELRYFNSHTVKDRVLARLEFVDAVYQCSKELSEELGHYNTRDGESSGQAELYRDFFKNLTVDSWNDRLWYFILATRDNRTKYRNLIKLGREKNLFNLNRLNLDDSEYAEVETAFSVLDYITEEGGIH